MKKIAKAPFKKNVLPALKVEETEVSSEELSLLNSILDSSPNNTVEPLLILPEEFSKQALEKLSHNDIKAMSNPEWEESDKSLVSTKSNPFDIKILPNLEPHERHLCLTMQERYNIQKQKKYSKNKFLNRAVTQTT